MSKRINESITHLLACLLTWLLLVPAAGATTNITVKADRNPVALEESFDLVFEADGAVDGEPDFTALEKDFDILSTRSGSSMRIVNMQISSAKTWTLTVFARREGVITIPSIRFGGLKSPAASITVKQSLPGASGAGRQADVFVESNAAAKEVYVQQQLLVTVRLYVKTVLYRSLDTANATLSAPRAAGKAIVEHLDSDSEYQTTINNQRYQVLERAYAVYPQESGTLTLEPIRFQGQVSRRSSFLFDPFGARPQAIVRRSAAVTINVKPIPAAFSGAHWLPATDLRLSEEWSKDPMAMQADEPVTRTLNIIAEGLTASQLPALASIFSDDFKHYPDQALLENRKSVAGSTGIRQEKSAIIPTAAGDFTLPAIRLAWWNTETDALDYAVLPPRAVKVLAGRAAAAIMPPAVDINTNAAGLADNVADDTGSAVKPAASGKDAGLWNWLSITLAICWLVTLLALAIKAKGKPAQRAVGHDNAGLRKIVSALSKACDQDNAWQAKQALLAWGRLRWGGQRIFSLGDIGQHCRASQYDGQDNDFADALAALSRALYGREQTAWQGQPLWSAFQNYQKAAAPEPQAKQQARLEPLHRL